jgi:hypothetical protein
MSTIRMSTHKLVENPLEDRIDAIVAAWESSASEDDLPEISDDIMGPHGVKLHVVDTTATVTDPDGLYVKEECAWMIAWIDLIAGFFRWVIAMVRSPIATTRSTVDTTRRQLVTVSEVAHGRHPRLYWAVIGVMPAMITIAIIAVAALIS